MLIIKNDQVIIEKFTIKFNELWNRGKTLEKPIKINPYDLTKLKKNIGKWVIISGKPTNWNISRSGHLFIDFGEGRNQFTFVLWKEGLEKLKENGFDLKKLNDAEIELKGELINHKKYGLEITTSDPESIRIIK
jgi:hypothetical protein